MNAGDVLHAIVAAAMARNDQQQENVLERALAESFTVPAKPRNDDQTANIAFWYANRGLPVFPLEPGAKRPLKGSRGFKDATRDFSQIIHWFGAREGDGALVGDRNIGIPTGYMFDVIDIDGPDGCQTFVDDMIGNGAWLTVHGITATPRGLHLWVPADPNARNYSYPGDTGIDYRGQGGYVVVPPSHVDGTLYRWLVCPVS